MDNFFPKFTNLRSESIIFALQKFRALCRFGFVLRYLEFIFLGRYGFLVRILQYQ